MKAVVYYPAPDEAIGVPEAIQGYSLPGYYFWDETWGYCHGPFPSEKEAEEACNEYARQLEEE